jgi:predicted transcriptional regulator of viral defense system
MTDTIKNTIDKFETGYIFTIDDFSISVNSPKNVSKILNHFVSIGYLRKLSKGKFYKPQTSKFGELQPDTYQTVKDLLQKDGKLIGYITGYSAFNDFALTTQVSAI